MPITSKRIRPAAAFVAVAMLFAIIASGAVSSRADEKSSGANGDSKIAPVVEERPRIQMAILLDTSGSMKGLIHQARTQLWKVVNEFASAKRGSQRPVLEVALYEYGHASLGSDSGFMRQILPLSDNLDLVSEELFKLVVGGSKEYCGQVIGKATGELQWSNAPRDLKCIFIAGNEAFTQGPVDFRDACQAAAEKGVTVSTIFCGNHDEGIKTMWQEASQLADGSYVSINQDEQVAAISAPQDKQLSDLSVKLNTTYIAFGSASARATAMKRQAAQDTNAANSGQSSAVLRAQVKISHLYCNPTWDLCDAFKLGKIKLEDLKADQLPENMRKMSVEERKEYVAKKSKEREQIQLEIKKLSDARAKFVAMKRKENAVDEKSTLDSAIITALKKQATAKAFTFAK